MARPRRKQRHKRRSAHIEPLPDPLQAIIDSDSSSVPSSIADDYVGNLLNQSDTEFQSPSDSPRKRSSNPRVASSSTSPAKSPARRKPHPRKIVMEDCMAAFAEFSQRNNAQLTYSCEPTPDSRHRLALHRSAELLGASSSSMGNGKDRCVIMKWPTGKRVPISEAAFERGVARILDELLPEKPVRRSGGRERQREFARQMRLAKLWNDDVDADEDDAKTEAETTVGNAEKVGRGNIGFDMLEKMGWSEGTGLGAERDGRVDPIIGQRRMRRAGIGST